MVVVWIGRAIIHGLHKDEIDFCMNAEYFLGYFHRVISRHADWIYKSNLICNKCLYLADVILYAQTF